MIYYNVCIGKSDLVKTMFATADDDWEVVKESILFTEMRYLPALLVRCGVAKTINEVVKKKPELDKRLEEPDFVVVKYGKRHIAILIGE